MSCPACGNPKVRHASTIAKEIWRRVCRSRKRYCPRCGNRWHLDGPRSLLDRIHPSHIVILLGLLIALLFTFEVSLQPHVFRRRIINTTSVPSRWR